MLDNDKLVERQGRKVMGLRTSADVYDRQTAESIQFEKAGNQISLNTQCIFGPVYDWAIFV